MLADHTNHVNHTGMKMWILSASTFSAARVESKPYLEKFQGWHYAKSKPTISRETQPASIMGFGFAAKWFRGTLTGS
jgi:hypothetical protein